MFILQIGEQFTDIVAPESLAIIKRQLERGATHVVQKNQQLLRIDARVLRRSAEEEIRVPHHELIEGLAGGDQYA